MIHIPKTKCFSGFLTTIGILSVLSVQSMDTNPIQELDNLSNMIIITLGNRIITQREQQAAGQKITIQPLQRSYFLECKKLTETTKLKPLVIRLFNTIDTIDNNLNYYLNDPTNAALQSVLEGALDNCFRIRNLFLDTASQARMDNNEELRIIANIFLEIANKIYDTTKTLMANGAVATTTATTKKSKNVFKRLFGG